MGDAGLLIFFLSHYLNYIQTILCSYFELPSWSIPAKLWHVLKWLFLQKNGFFYMCEIPSEKLLCAHIETVSLSQHYMHSWGKNTLLLGCGHFLKFDHKKQLGFLLGKTNNILEKVSLNKASPLLLFFIALKAITLQIHVINLKIF